MKEKRIRWRKLNYKLSPQTTTKEKGEKKRKKKGAGFSRLQGRKIHVILDTMINVTLVLCFVNECKRYVIFANAFNVAIILSFVYELILA